MWCCAATNIAHAQGSYFRVARLTFAEWRYAFRGFLPEWQHPFLTMSAQKLFNKFLTFMNLYKHAINSSIYSRDLSGIKFFANIGFV